VSESNHAHGQKLLGKSLKPLALATFATKVFLSRVQTAFVRGGGNPKWHHLQDRVLQRRAPALRAEDAMLMLTDVDTDEAGGNGQPDDVLVAPPAMARGDPLPEKLSCPHLNPLMHAFNTRLRSAKQLGHKVDKEFQKQAMTELRNSYQMDAEAKARMQNEYQLYLSANREQQLNVAEMVDECKLASTFWGWGSESLPIPFAAVQREVANHGLVPSAVASGEGASDAFRIRADECDNFMRSARVVRGSSCGGSPFNECRPPSFNQIARLYFQ
jgi:hypothetical protein